MIFQLTKAGFNFLNFTSDFNVFQQLQLCTLGLYSNNVPFDWLRAVADLTPAAWTGYTPIDLLVPLQGPYTDSILQNWFTKLPMHSFGKCTALPEVDYGLYLTDTDTGLILVGLCLLDEPINVEVGVTPYVNMLIGEGQASEVSSYEADAS